MRSMMPGMMAKNIGPSTVCVSFPTKPVAVNSIRNRLPWLRLPNAAWQS